MANDDSVAAQGRLPMTEKSPRAYCTETRDSIRKKANRYKRWSRFAVFSMTLLPLVIPIALLVFSEWQAKVVVSTLSALLAVGSALISLEKPHERWVLYRRYHRLVDAEKTRYEYGVGEYGELGHTQAGARAVERVSGLEVLLHKDWEGLVPSSAEVVSGDPALHVAPSLAVREAGKVVAGSPVGDKPAAEK